MASLLLGVSFYRARPRQRSGRSRTCTFDPGASVERGRRGDQQVLADVDDVVAMAAEVRLAAHDARQHVVRRRRPLRPAARRRASSRRCSSSCPGPANSPCADVERVPPTSHAGCSATCVASITLLPPMKRATNFELRALVDVLRACRSARCARRS